MAKLGEDMLDRPVAWGQKLIETQDHDPLYTGLWGYLGKNQTGTRDRVRRFMLSYWSFYSVGASWFISGHEGADFWHWLKVAAENEAGPEKLQLAPAERWPRAHERRHWRGQKCVDSVIHLAQRFPRPEDAVLSLEDLPGRINLQAVKLEVTTWPQFGPWIAFKAADMLERVLGVPVDFPLTTTSMYRDPQRGAEMAAPFIGNVTPQGVTDVMLHAYRNMKAPPGGDRPVGVQEVETVLCKWKSARNGHYHIGADTASNLRELELWGAQDLARHYPSLPA